MKFKDGDFKTPQACSTGGVFNCVAVAITPEGVGVRDTKDPQKTTLSFTHREWDAFIESAKKGQFDVQK